MRSTATLGFGDHGSAATVVALLVLAGSATSQGDRELGAPSFREFQLVRMRPQPYVQALTIRGGMSGVMPQEEDPSVGREEAYAPDGFIWYRTDHFSDDGVLDAYAGRDGAIINLRQDRLTDGGGGRIELSTRYFPFYREGFYRGDDWVPTGRYEGQDYGVYGGISTQLSDGAMFEVGAYYRQNNFERNDTTEPGYKVPDDYAAYGGRAYFEQGTLQLDSQTGLPSDGFLATILVEYERNNSSSEFGTDLWKSKLPTSLFRGLLHLEWYFPTEGASVWELRVDGSMSDDLDRVQMFDATKPIGVWWGDAALGYRLQIGRELFVTPFGQLQYTKTLNERGESGEEDFWYGGGLRARYDLGEAISILANYSYLSNPNRPSISYKEDLYGEHQFFAGVEVRFGASRY